MTKEVELYESFVEGQKDRMFRSNRYDDRKLMLYIDEYRHIVRNFVEIGLIAIILGCVALVGFVFTNPFSLASYVFLILFGVLDAIGATVVIISEVLSQRTELLDDATIRTC